MLAHKFGQPLVVQRPHRDTGTTLWRNDLGNQSLAPAASNQIHQCLLGIRQPLWLRRHLLHIDFGELGKSRPVRQQPSLGFTNSHPELQALGHLGDTPIPPQTGCARCLVQVSQHDVAHTPAGAEVLRNALADVAEAAFIHFTEDVVRASRGDQYLFQDFEAQHILCHDEQLGRQRHVQKIDSWSSEAGRTGVRPVGRRCSRC